MKEEFTEPLLKGFLSNYESHRIIVDIKIQPKITYFEEGRDCFNLNFDFILRNLTNSKVVIRFIKAAVYDKSGKLITFRHVNHNGVGMPSIHTIGKFEMASKDTIDVFNPFHQFPKDVPIDHLRYMFTFLDTTEEKEYYYGNIIVKPRFYNQKTKLFLPLKGTLTILDGHDFYSHHRRFAMSIVRKVTENKFKSNFSRFGLDFTIIGIDGNTRRMKPEEYSKNYDFHFEDARRFYTDGADVLAPAKGEVVACVNDLDDLYDSKFDLDDAVKEDKIEEIAGNYLVIKHNDREFSHLFHLKKDSILVTLGEKVERGQTVGKVGFSGASTTYSHLHYQLMDGPDFLVGNPLPVKFSDVTLLIGSKKRKFDTLALDTGDLMISND